MSAWEQVDAFRKAAEVVESQREWRAFAYLVPMWMEEGYRRSATTLRIRGRVNDKRLKVERPCYFRPGAWRSVGFIRVAAMETDFRAFGDVFGETGAYVSGLTGLRIAHDEWLSKGGPRVSRPFEIEVRR